MADDKKSNEFMPPDNLSDYYVMDFNVSYESSSSVSANSDRGNTNDNNRIYSIYRHIRALYLISAVLVIIIILLFIFSTATYCIQYFHVKTSLKTVDKTTNNLNSTVTKLHQNTLGLSAGSPAKSCAAILKNVPQSPSGYYWLHLIDGRVAREYCDMTKECGGIKGGWMRVADFNALQEGSSCPEGSHLLTDSGNPIGCIMNSFNGGCISSWFATHGLKSTKVCGSVIAYQFGMLNGFNTGNSSLRSSDTNLDSNYVDGISITYGHHPRKHIWTLAAGGCPCHRNRPSFVKNDFYCGRWRCKENCMSDPRLWMGFGICASQGPDFFFKKLKEPTTQIEMRMCRDEDRNDEDIALQSLQLYVQ